jgi:plasmid maintenance system antidote protein VapI
MCMLIDRTPTIQPMSGRSLTPEENDRVVEAIREILKEPGVTQTSLAPKLGIGQPTISALLGGRNVTSYGVARRVAALRRVHVDALLGIDARVEYDSPPGIAAAALGNHRDWKAARAGCELRYGRRIEDGVLDDVAKMTLSKMPERLDGEIVYRFAEALMIANERGRAASTDPEPEAPKRAKTKK